MFRLPFSTENSRVLSVLFLTKKTMRQQRGIRSKMYQDRVGEFRWKTLAGNNRTIGASTEGFKNAKDCESNAKMNGVKKIDKEL